MSQRIPEGLHTGKGVKGSEQYGETNNGNEQIAIDVELEGFGPVTVFLIFTEKSAPYSLQKLRALGWTGDSLLDLSGIDTKPVTVSVRYEDYEGQERMKVDIVATGSVTLSKPLDEKGKKAFAARWSAFTKGSVPAPKTPTVTPDEIPF